MHVDSLPDQGLFRFSPPYQGYTHVHLGWTPQDPRPGASVVWFMASAGDIISELEWLRTRPSWLPLFIVLPNTGDILSLVPVLRKISQLGPRAVIPAARIGLAPALRTLLAAPPHDLSKAVTHYLHGIGMIQDIQTGKTIEEIFRLAPQSRNVENLAARMCRSRRTLGRFFQDRGLPVPSHWLQFARILHVATQIQNTNKSVNRIAARYGYTDGFTMSNSMKRLTGYRPSFVREHLGWEWVVSIWIRRENL